MSRGPRTGRAWREFRVAVFARSNVCGICGLVIDMTLSGMHPDGPTVNHRVPLALGGALLDPDNAEPAHRRCNTAQGPRVSKPIRSRDW